MNSAIQFSTPPNPSVSTAAGPAPIEPVRKVEPPKTDDGTAELRLVIEENQDGSGFVYKTMNRRTGEVVQVLPRDDVLKMQDDEAYTPGAVVDQRT